MSEQATVEQVQVSAEQPTPVSPFAKEAWNETPTVVKTEEAVIEKKDEVKPDIVNEEILNPNDYLKNKWGWETEEAADTEIKQLREKAAKVPEETKWENEESKSVFELLKGGKKKEALEIVALQDKLGNLISSEVGEDNAADIIKTGLKLKHKDLTDKEIDYKFNKMYSLPKEPVQTSIETDEEFEERQATWKEQVEDIKISRIIDAKTMKPELEKAKVELKFPELEKPTEQKANEPDPEMVKQVRERFLNKLESDYSKVDGFNTQVKDELVEIPVSFKIPDEEKTAIKAILEKDFDVDAYIGTRWFAENGEPKIEQIVSDLYLLNNTDKVLSGIANKSATERLLEANKQAKNIDLNGKVHQNTFQPNADGKANISPFAKEAWSDKPPVLQS